MKVLIVDNKNRIPLLSAFAEGVLYHGDEYDIRPTADIYRIDEWADVVVIADVYPWSRLLMDEYRKAEKHVVLLEGGYFNSEYTRASINDYLPLTYMQSVVHPDDRWKRLGIKLFPHRRGFKVMVCGDSLSAALWYLMAPRDDLDPLAGWAKATCQKVAKRTRKSIIYRPDKTGNQIPVFWDNHLFSPASSSIQDELLNVWCMVSYRSFNSLHALIAGVPNIVLGENIVAPLALTDTKRIDDPYYPDDKRRYQFLCDLSYTQWQIEEYKNGTAWDTLRSILITFSFSNLFFGKKN